MTLTTKQRQALKAKAHKLKPVILLGNAGLTPSVQMEIGRALAAHELVKIRIPLADRALRAQVVADICAYQHAESIQLIGNIAIIYRENPDKTSICS